MVNISLILPCRNEELTIGICIKKAKDIFKEKGYLGEIIVSDSSTDKSAEIAHALGAKVIKHGKVGYGNAYLEAFSKAKGKYIVMVDSDDTYDIKELPLFIDQLSKFEFVNGSRFKGSIADNAMPWLHRYIGNPLLTKTLNFLFHSNMTDVHCGFKAIRKESLAKLQLHTLGMEFASELVIAVVKNKLSCTEVPVSYQERKSPSKLHSWRDGWRHLRFMLLFSPTYIFVLPACMMMIIGLTMILMSMKVLNQLVGASIVVLGFQVLHTGFFARVYATNIGFEKHDPLIDKLATILPLERSIIVGLAGVIMGSTSIVYFTLHKSLSPKPLLVSFLFLMLCFQMVFSVLFLSMLLIQKKNE